jgi:hypothetical protein
MLPTATLETMAQRPVSVPDAAILASSSTTHLTGRFLRRRYGVLLVSPRQAANQEVKCSSEHLSQCPSARVSTTTMLLVVGGVPARHALASQCERFPTSESQAGLFRLVQPASPPAQPAHCLSTVLIARCRIRPQVAITTGRLLNHRSGWRIAEQVPGTTLGQSGAPFEVDPPTTAGGLAHRLGTSAVKTVFWYATLGASIGRGDRIEGLRTAKIISRPLALLKVTTRLHSCPIFHLRNKAHVSLDAATSPGRDVADIPAHLIHRRRARAVASQSRGVHLPAWWVQCEFGPRITRPFVSHGMKMMGLFI